MKPTDTGSSKPSKKVFDVMRPGKAPASATSKPVIVSNSPKAKDFQFTDSKKDESATSGVPELQGVVEALDPEAAKPADNTPFDVSTEAIARGDVPADPEPAPEEPAPAPEEPAPEPE